MTLFVTSRYLITLSGAFPQSEPSDCLDTSERKETGPAFMKKGPIYLFGICSHMNIL